MKRPLIPQMRRALMRWGRDGLVSGLLCDGRRLDALGCLMRDLHERDAEGMRPVAGVCHPSKRQARTLMAIWGASREMLEDLAVWNDDPAGEPPASLDGLADLVAELLRRSGPRGRT